MTLKRAELQQGSAGDGFLNGDARSILHHSIMGNVNGDLFDPEEVVRMVRAEMCYR
ncbi:MAG: hypothetical protein ACLQAT_20675 [Candidatus Binataceae bacterium]